jgi:hypothetical protein
MKWRAPDRRRRLVRDVVAALADDVPISWPSLARHASTPAERGILTTLEAIAGWRRRARPDEVQTPSPAAVAATILSIVTAVQLAAAMVLVASGLIGSRPDLAVKPQLWMMVAFIGGALLLQRAHHDPRVRFLIAAYLAAASAFSRTLVARATDWPIGRAIATGFYPEAFLPACLWHFVTIFPRVERFTTLDRVSRALARLSLVVSLSLCAANLAIGWGWAGSNAFVLALHRDRPLFWYIVAALSLPALVVMRRRATRAGESDRSRVLRFSRALAFCAAPFFVLELALVLTPPFSRWFRTVPPPPGRLWIEIPVIASFIAIPLLTAAAVVLDRTFDLRAWLRRATQYALARGTLVAAVAVPLALLGWIGYTRRAESLAAIAGGPTGRVLLTLSIVAGLALALRQPLTRLIDRAFFRSSLDRHAHLGGALDLIRQARGRRELAAAIADRAERVLGVEHARVFMHRSADGWMSDDAAGDVLPDDSALASLCRDRRTAIDVAETGPIWRLLPASDQRWLRDRQLAYLAPLTRRDGTLHAIVGFGAKRDRLAMTADDRWFVNSLMTAAAAAWDRDADQPGAPVDADESAIECSRCGIIAAHAPLPCACRAAPAVAGLPALLQRRFDIERRLGAGAMGVVYLARDRDLGRSVALKTLPALQPAAIDRVRREARMMAAISHPAIASVYDILVWRDTPILVIEYLAEGTLAGRIRTGPLPLIDVAAIARSLCSALEQIHAAGLLHRDIKPSNVGLTDTGSAKLLDFGIATLTAGQRDIAGTPAYWPPEAANGAVPTAQYDLWALNVLLFECVTGRHPFIGDAPDEAGLATALQDLSPHLADYFSRALAPNPSRRPPDAATMAQEFLADSQTQEAVRSPQPGKD